MSTVTIISDDERVVPGTAGAGRVAIEPGALTEALGWELKPRGLCRGDTCVPVRDQGSLFAGPMLDVAAVAAALGRATVVDDGAAMAAVALPAADRRGALVDRELPPLRLPDLNGRQHDLAEWRGRKRLLVAFSSWCGCRYDLPGWQALHDELAPSGFTALAVAIDDDPEEVRPFADGLSMPVLIDRQHLLTEVLAISNVPTVVWIDEEDRIVRPNGVAFGTDLFRDFTGVAAGPHLDLVRRWVATGELPPGEDPAMVVSDLSDDEVLARLHFRLGAAARRRDDERRGDAATARRHLEAAAALAPYDFTVRRAAMPLVGEDPFGQDFLDLYDEWLEAGSPFHGLAAVGPESAGPDGARTPTPEA